MKPNTVSKEACLMTNCVITTFIPVYCNKFE